MCNGICKRLYRAHRLAPGVSLYVSNKRCSNCDRFISMEGVYQKKTSSNCRCCNRPVRHTPYSGRKSIGLYKASDISILVDEKNTPRANRKRETEMERQIQNTTKPQRGIL